MPQVGRTARITLKGFDREGIDHNSPLEDQCVLTYRAARRYAEQNKFKRGTHRGHSGLTGPMVMKRITSALFPDTDADHVDRLNGLINQVLRKTDACVCIAHPTKREESPIWFVNDTMPKNIVVVALSHAKGKTPPLAPTDTWRDRQEARLTAEEAGETKTPGPVDVHYQEPTALAGGAEQNREEHAQFLTEIMEIFARTPVPLTVPEVHALYKPDLHRTTVRSAMDQLFRDGLLHKRKETDDERRLRANGRLPKGKTAFLWWPSEMIPERRTLPEGAPVTRAAMEWAQARREDLDKAMDAVLEVLSRSYPKGTTNRPRSIGRIAEVSGLPQLKVKQALDELLTLGFVYKAQNSSYYLADRQRGSKDEIEPEPDYLNPTPESIQAEVEGEAELRREMAKEAEMSAPPADRDELVQEFMRLAEQLTQAPTDPEAETLRAENERLSKDNEKLRQAVKSLRATIEALTDL